MKYIGCDFHPSFQQVAMLDTETGELVERRLVHGTAEARVFYESLSKPVVVGVEASGTTYWFERLLAELGHELWMGDATAIRQQDGRKQKHDRRDAKLILKLIVENRFPRILDSDCGRSGSATVADSPTAPGANAGAYQ